MSIGAVSALICRDMATHVRPDASFGYTTVDDLCRDRRMQSKHPPDDASPTRRRPALPFVPSEEWIEQFDAQCTEILLKRARRYAALRAQDLGWEMPTAGPNDPDELVDNIVRDTLAGVLRWDPNVRGFDRHLFDAVRSRVTRYAKRAAQYPHESMDSVDYADTSPLMVEVEAQLRMDAPEATIDVRLRLIETVRCLRKLAQGKPLVQRLLTAFERRATDKESVMRIAKMTSAEYQNARRQLARLVERLPSHLKPRGQLVAKGA